MTICYEIGGILTECSLPVLQNGYKYDQHFTLINSKKLKLKELTFH